MAYHRLDDLEPNSFYELQVIAVNDLGQSDVNDQFIFSTAAYGINSFFCLLFYLFIYLFVTQDTQFFNAEILNYENYIGDGRGLDLEIGNVSAWQAKLKHWSAIDKRWSNAFWFVPTTHGYWHPWANRFQGHWKKPLLKIVHELQQKKIKTHWKNDPEKKQRTRQLCKHISVNGGLQLLHFTYHIISYPMCKIYYIGRFVTCYEISTSL